MFIKQDVFLSVIIPTFNRIHYLYHTLRFLLHQKDLRNNIEVLVVDSGSDNTKEVIDSFRNEFLQTNSLIIIKYIKLHNCSNRALLRHTGAKEAKGQYLLFLDNDILVDPSLISRHCRHHQQNRNNIILNLRRNLLEIDNTEVLNHCLNNFDNLEQFSWINDIRTNLLRNTNDLQKQDVWRFLYSHCFSISRDNYFFTGGFDKKFGNSWGYEDIEFGFRCMTKGFYFHFDLVNYIYHLPHSAPTISGFQTNNTCIFLKKQNYYQIELFLGFEQLYSTYISYINSLGIFQDNEETKSIIKKYNIILGSLNNPNIAPPKKHYLGVFIPHINYSYTDRILILKCINLLPVIFQLAIISEAFRISNKIDIEKDYKSSINLDYFKTMLGLKFDTSERGEVVSLVSPAYKSKKKIFTLILPDVFSPQKRFFYCIFAYYFLQNGCFLQIKDLRRTNFGGKENFGLPNNIQEKLKDCIKQTFGNIKTRVIISEEILLTEDIYYDLDQSIIINDIGLIGKTKKKDSYNPIIMELFYIQFINDFLSQFRTKKQFSESVTILVFMERSYLEDGIDLALQALSKLNEYNFNIIIKTGSVIDLIEQTHPDHNITGKRRKTYQEAIRNTDNIKSLLLNIYENKLENIATIIEKNNSIYEIAQLIDSADIILNSSRLSIPTIEMYIALYLGKKLIIPKFIHMSSELKQNCLLIDYTEEEISKLFNIPNNSTIAFTNCGNPKVDCLRELIISCFSYKPKQSTIQSIFTKKQKHFSKLCKEITE